MKSDTYTPIAKVLHWAIVTLVVAQFVTSWLMPEVRGTTDPSSLMNLHMSFGIIVLPLALFLLLMRRIRPVTEVVTRGPAWQQKAAIIMRYVLYALLIVVPFSGWAFASGQGWAVHPFGLFELPMLFVVGSEVGHAFGELHSTLATVIGLLVLGHAGAALYHHFILKDTVLTRMLPKSTLNKETE